MKLIITLVATIFVALALTSCEKPNPAEQVLDPNAMIYINASGTKTEVANPAYPTALEVIENATEFVFMNPDFGQRNDQEPWLNNGIHPYQKDTENMRIKMWGDHVIYQGNLNLLFVGAKDILVVTRIDPATGEPNPSYSYITDTLAYIPNSQLEFARPLMEAAFEEGRYDNLYELFQNSYSFIPINGADWLKLKAEGKN